MQSKTLMPGKVVKNYEVCKNKIKAIKGPQIYVYSQ